MFLTCMNNLLNQAVNGHFKLLSSDVRNVILHTPVRAGKEPDDARQRLYGATIAFQQFIMAALCNRGP